MLLLPSILLIFNKVVFSLILEVDEVEDSTTHVDQGSDT